jgi:hypothetical protein
MSVKSVHALGQTAEMEIFMCSPSRLLRNLAVAPSVKLA